MVLYGASGRDVSSVRRQGGWREEGGKGAVGPGIDREEGGKGVVGPGLDPAVVGPVEPDGVGLRRQDKTLSSVSGTDVPRGCMDVLWQTECRASGPGGIPSVRRRSLLRAVSTRDEVESTGDR